MTYRIYDNGTYRDMTTEEIEEIEKMQQESQNQVQEKTDMELVQEEIERQAQAIEDLIMMTLGGE